MKSLREQLLDEISIKIITYFVKNKFDARSSKTDGALSAEDFLTGLYNILYKQDSCKYRNLNHDEINYPGIDLLDPISKTGVQVTVTETIDKVKKSFNTIPKIEENKEYDSVVFFVQDMKLSRGHKKFGPTFRGYKVRVECVKELLSKISDLVDLEHIKEIHLYIKIQLVFPDINSDINIDSAVFSLMFNALKEKTENIYDTSEEIYKTALPEKKELYASSWNLMVALYKESLGIKNTEIDLHRLSNYRGMIEEVFSEDLDEVQKESIQGYLRTQSLMTLHTNNNDPILGIKELSEKMRDDLKIMFVPQSHLLSFCLNMFFACDVFPLVENQNDNN